MDDPADEERDRELAQLELQPVETVRQLDALARDRRANKAAFGR